MRTKKWMKQLLVLLVLINGLNVKAQGFDTGPITPAGILDTLFDKDGNIYNLSDLMINQDARTLTNGKTAAALTVSCSPGYFNLYFENGSLGNGTTAQQNANQAVFCQLFSDISNFIPSPLSTNGLNHRVNIWVRNINNIYANPNASGIAGAASQFYVAPYSTTKGGINNGLIYNTIVSGVDAYTNVAPPVSIFGSDAANNASILFHGLVTFNFNGLVNWNTNLAAIATSTQGDLYSVALHEITHALGFASLIGANGQSKYATAGYNYYSKYDLFLKQNNIPLITQQSGANCSANYQYQFNPALSTSVLANTNTTSCTNNVKFAGSANQYVYCPPSFNGGSSLSHFPDACHTGTYAGGNSNFVMNPSGGNGLNFRFLQPEERSVLCDLGYSVNATYGSTAVAQGTINYGGSACNGIGIVGVNDGFVGNGYTYTSVATTTAGGAGPITFPIASLLANDYNAVGNGALQLLCPEIMVGVGTLSVNATNIVFTPSSIYQGPILLRYTPYIGTNYGSITYVYGYVVQKGCAPTNPCDLVQNGGFESMISTANCGDGYVDISNHPNDLKMSCWNSYARTPDLFAKDCLNNTIALSGGENSGYFNLGVNTYDMTPTISAPYTSTVNTHVIGFGDYKNTLTNLSPTQNRYYAESMSNFLSSPLLPGQVYKVSFWAYNVSANGYYPRAVNAAGSVTTTYRLDFNENRLPNIFTISSASATAISALTNDNYSPTASGLTPLLSYTLAPINTWQYVSTTFTYNGTSNGNILLIGGDYLKNDLAGYYPYNILNNDNSAWHYTIFDDLSILPANIAPIFAMPTTTFCGTANTVTDLMQYASPSGGNFNGPGVTLNPTTGLYNFSTATLTPGVYQIRYTYTTTNAPICPQTAIQQVTVNPNVAVPPSYIICQGQNTTLTPKFNCGVTSASYSITWSPTVALSCTNCPTPIANPITSTTYVAVFTPTNGAASFSNAVLVTVTPSVTLVITATLPTICGTTATTLSASGAVSYTWMPGTNINPTIIVTPTTATIYTLTGNTGSCNGIQTKTVLVNYVTPVSNLCCSSTNSTIGTSITSSVNIPSGTYSTANSVFAMQGVITFTDNTIFNGYTLRMSPQTKLVVNNGVTLTFNNCKLFSCTELWDGIYSNPSGSNFAIITFSNTSVEDMYSGIICAGDKSSTIDLTASSNALIKIVGSTFNKNYYNINMNSMESTIDPNNIGVLSVQSSSFTSNTSTTSPGTTLKPSSVYTYDYNQITNGGFGNSLPYVNFPRTLMGIQLNNLNSQSGYVKIGDETNIGNTNVFDNLDFGLDVTNTNLKIYNNYFKNITGSLIAADEGNTVYAQGPAEIGVAINYAGNSVTIGNGVTTPTNGNPFPLGNKFETCNKAINANDVVTFTANGNVFTSISNDVPVVITSTTTPVPNTYYYYKGQNAITFYNNLGNASINNNYIQNEAVGINVTTNHSANNKTLNINNNVIFTSATKGPPYCRYAIKVSKAGAFTPTLTSIASNSISAVYNGVDVSALDKNVSIAKNTITIDNTTKTNGYTNIAGLTRNAIRLYNAPNTKIQGNTLSSNAPSIPTTTNAFYLNGVYVVNSASVAVECNLTTNLGRCFTFDGTCASSRWLANTQQNSYRGLELANNGVIGKQGAQTYTGTPNLSANTWTVINQETYANASPSVNTTSQMYLKATTAGSLITQPTLNFASSGIASYTIGAGQGINPVSGTSYTCNTSGGAQRLMGSTKINQKGIDTTSVDSLAAFAQLATNNTNAYEVFAEEFVHQNQQLVYDLVAQDNINPVDGSRVDNFYDANQNTTIGMFSEVKEAIANNDLSTAIAKNNVVPVTNYVVAKYKQVNELLLNYLSDNNYLYTSTQIKTLLGYANECAVKGEYVVTARNLYNAITKQVNDYANNCDSEAKTTRKHKSTLNDASSIASNTNFNLYPNPNNGTMSLYYDLGNYANALMQIYDVNGKIVANYSLTTKNGVYLINESGLTNGIYFYKIVANENVIHTNKLVIIK